MAKLLTPAEVAARMGITKQSLFKMVRRGQFPPPSVRLTRECQRWRESLIESIEKGQWKPKEKP